MPQEFPEVPSYFPQVLHQDLNNLHPVPSEMGPGLLPYLDDLLLCSGTKEASVIGSIDLLP